MPFRELTSVSKVSLALLLGIAIIGGPAAGQAQQHDNHGSPGLGLAVALNVCTSCHIVMPDQEFPPIFDGPPKPPTFSEIANRPDVTEESLRNFISTTHSSMTMPVRMPNPELTDDQIKNVISFILSLRKKQ
ncbi:MAG: cytochrome c [Beijerinckiaceae bacterium]|jgi:mono/diheme cytochrome c family protein